MSPSSTTNRLPRNSAQPTPGGSSSSNYNKAQPRPTSPPKIVSTPRSIDPGLPSQPPLPEPNGTQSRPESKPTHPFAQSNGLVQIIHPTTRDMIEEESRFWDEFATDVRPAVFTRRLSSHEFTTTLQIGRSAIQSEYKRPYISSRLYSEPVGILQ
jgi:hypothetical protein